MKALFTAILVMPQGYHCKFKVFRSGNEMWEFTNENHELTIHLFKQSETNWTGTLSHHLGGAIQNNILITQAIFELIEFYRH
jgi:hypothetical protein